MYEVTLSIKLLFMLCMWNPAFSLDLDLMDIIVGHTYLLQKLKA